MRIIEGWIKYIIDLVRHKESNTTEYRHQICNQCEHNKHGVCQLCHCVILAKIRCHYIIDEDGKAIDGCPLKKW